MTYALPTNVTNFFDIFTYANETASNYTLGFWIVIATFFISFTYMLQYGGRKSLVGSMLFTSIVSVLLRVLNLITDVIFVPVLVLLLAVVVLYILKGEN